MDSGFAGRILCGRAVDIFGISAYAGILRGHGSILEEERGDMALAGVVLG